MPKVKFLHEYTVKAAGGKTFSVGEIVELTHHSARHYVNRGVAEIIIGKAKPEQPTVVTETEAPKPEMAEPSGKKSVPASQPAPASQKRTARKSGKAE